MTIPKLTPPTTLALIITGFIADSTPEFSVVILGAVVSDSAISVEVVVLLSLVVGIGVGGGQSGSPRVSSGASQC